jgi:outer membrane protein OmpA-like peptidoglycan-associated protein
MQAVERLAKDVEARVASCEPAAPPVAALPPGAPPTPQAPAPQARSPIIAPGRVHFALGRDELGEASRSVLDEFARVLLQDATTMIEVHGHTDARGSAAFNRDLSVRRAEQVRRYLVRSGISPDRIQLKGLGGAQLLTSGHTVLDHARNRRVDLVVLNRPDLEVVAREPDLSIENASARKQKRHR